MRAPTDGTYTSAWSPDGRQIAGGSAYFRWASPWHVGDCQPRTLVGRQGTSTALAVSPDDGLLASTGENGQVYRWSPISGRLLAVLPAPTNA